MKYYTVVQGEGKIPVHCLKYNIGWNGSYSELICTSNFCRGGNTKFEPAYGEVSRHIQFWQFQHSAAPVLHRFTGTFRSSCISYVILQDTYQFLSIFLFLSPLFSEIWFVHKTCIQRFHWSKIQCNKFFLEKMDVAQPVRKITSTYKIKIGCVTVFTRSRAN
jgi:hypothetical protein